VNKAPRLDAVRLTFSYSYPEYSWSPDDTMDSDVDYSFSEIDEMLDYEKMAKREHKWTDEIGNMVTFLSGLGCAKKPHRCLRSAADFPVKLKPAPSSRTSSSAEDVEAACSLFCSRRCRSTQEAAVHLCCCCLFHAATTSRSEHRTRVRKPSVYSRALSPLCFVRASLSRFATIARLISLKP
jgi:hypothetical protein